MAQHLLLPDQRRLQPQRSKSSKRSSNLLRPPLLQLPQAAPAPVLKPSWLQDTCTSCCCWVPAGLDLHVLTSHNCCLTNHGCNRPPAGTRATTAAAAAEASSAAGALLLRSRRCCCHRTRNSRAAPSTPAEPAQQPLALSLQPLLKFRPPLPLGHELHPLLLNLQLVLHPVRSRP
jgi:hypothetical protein